MAQHFCKSLDDISVGRELRDTAPEKLHLISCRTRGAELLLVPSGELTNLVGGIIARYAECHKVDIFAVITLGNHYHILCRAPEAGLPLFAADINREMALRVNRLLGREGSLWSRRYDDLPAIRQVDSLEGLLYITTNCVHHGLVTHPRHWPGLTTYRQLLGAKPTVYSFFFFSDYHQAKRRAASRGEIVHREDFIQKIPLKIKPLPIFEELSREERIERIDELLEAKTAEICKKRRLDGKGFLGRKNVLAQAKQGTFPKDSKRSPRPACYCKDAQQIREFKKSAKLKRAWYQKSSVRFRLGEYEVEFPEFCLRPPLHYVPKDTSPPPT